MESLEDSREALVLVHMKTKATGLQCQLKMAGAEVWTVQTHSPARAEGRQAKAVPLLPQSFSRGSTGRHCPLITYSFWEMSLLTCPETCLLVDSRPNQVVSWHWHPGGALVPCDPFHISCFFVLHPEVPFSAFPKPVFLEGLGSPSAPSLGSCDSHGHDVKSNMGVGMLFWLIFFMLIHIQQIWKHDAQICPDVTLALFLTRV